MGCKNTTAVALNPRTALRRLSPSLSQARSPKEWRHVGVSAPGCSDESFHSGAASFETLYVSLLPAVKINLQYC